MTSTRDFFVNFLTSSSVNFHNPSYCCFSIKRSTNCCPSVGQSAARSCCDRCSVVDLSSALKSTDFFVKRDEAKLAIGLKIEPKFVLNIFGNLLMYRSSKSQLSFPTLKAFRPFLTRHADFVVINQGRDQVQLENSPLQKI